MMMRTFKRAAKAAVRRARIARTFANPMAYQRAARTVDGGQTHLRTRTGLTIIVRHNRWDAKIIEEQFIARDYLVGFRPPVGRPPVVVDVGGYIGDFTLYCAHELSARVIVYEPTAENWAVLQQNLTANPHLGGRVTAVQKGVAAQAEVVANVVVHGAEVHASGDFYAADPDAEQRTFPCDTLPEIFKKHDLTHVDLLKIDCEGGEYEIIAAAPTDTLARIGMLVMEWHKVPGWERKLPEMETTLRTNALHVRRHGQILYATR